MGAPPRTRGRGADRPRPQARTTGREAKHIPVAVAAARRLTEPEVLEQLRLTEAQVAFLDTCADGHPPRNALSAIQAIKLKLDFTTRKPRQELEVVQTGSTSDVTDDEWSVVAQLRHQVRGKEQA